MNILHATADPDLLTRLKEMLGSSARADIAVGYFFMSGFDGVAGEFARLDKVRILVGRTDRAALEEVALGLQQSDALRAGLDSDYIVQRRQREEVAQRAVASVVGGVAMLPQNADSESAVARLRDMTAVERGEVRAYLRSRLHAKAYLCWYDDHAEPGSAIVGSSNFSLAWFEGDTELNVRVTGDMEMAELGRWFDALWDDSEDISEDLVTELDRSWAIARTPPYHVYLKALRELYDNEVRGGELPLQTTDLANFQGDAVSRGLAMVEQHGGCYIGDVVGLGKTYIGAELLRQLAQTYPLDGPPLVICPAGLVPMWQRVSNQLGLGAAVLSQNRVAAPPDTVFDEELDRYVDVEPAGPGVVLQDEYPNHGAALVDEAHNFRNVNRRSTGLRSYLGAGDHKVILLSATPQNLGPRDIYRQLRLFLDEEDHGLNIEPVSLEAYFRNVEIWHKYRLDYENYINERRDLEASGDTTQTPPEPPERPKVPRADMETVMTPVFIRRRRKDIAEIYGDTAEVNGQPVRFPDPKLSNIDYRLDKVYATAGPFAELEALLKKHTAARYRAVDYLTAEARENPRYRDLLRARNRIAGLMKTLLFKRLESSIEAFRSTVNNFIQSNRNFQEILERGSVPTGQTATRLLAGESFDAADALAVLQQEEGGRDRSSVQPVADFQLGKWLSAIDADYEALRQIANRVADIGPDDDDKLRALMEFLEHPEVKSGKTLIFSESETTISYLHRQLNPDGADASIAQLSGAARGGMANVIKRFSPGQNLGPRERMPGAEINVLLATDVISEGQNLQDCARILNYDLHWNPVKLIQRFGRIDRIGSEHDVINLHNMWPDTAVDAELELTERLGNRIQSFHYMIGLDGRLLSDSEPLNEREMYRIYEQGELPEGEDGLDEVAANQRAIALLQRIQDENPDLWATIENLPDGIRSALAARVRPTEAVGVDGTQNVLQIEGAQMPLTAPSSTSSTPAPFDDPVAGETFVLLAEGDFKGCYAVGDDSDGNPIPRQIRPAQFLAAAECAPGTPAQPLPKATNERVMTAFDAFKTDRSHSVGTSRRRADSVNRRYLTRHLRIAEGQAAPSDAARVRTLRRIFTASLAPPIERALTEIRNMKIEGVVLVRRLEALRERYRLNPPDDAADTAGMEPQVIRIVCSDGLV